MKNLLSLSIGLVLVSIPTLYLKNGIFLYFIITMLSILSLKSKPVLSAHMFFILMFTIPYGLNGLVLESDLGNYLNNSFVASIPLYLYLIMNKENSFSDSRYSHLIFLFLVLLMLTNIIPGFLTFIGLGRTVRVSELINFINAILLSVVVSKSFISTKSFDLFSLLIVRLGFIAALGGLIQYFIDFKFFEYSYSVMTHGRLTIIPYIDPVDLFPFFIVPLSFAVNRFIKTKSIFSLITLITIIFSAVLTWSRGGLLSIVFVILAALFFNRKKLGSFTIILFAIISLLFISQDLIYNKSMGQVGRLESSANLASRVFLWEKSFRVIVKNSLLGVGFGNGPIAVFEEQSIGNVTTSIFTEYDTLTVRRSIETVHQFYLNWVISMGVLVIPLIFMLYYYCFSNFSLIVKNKINDSLQLFASSSLVAVIGLTIFYLQNTSNTYYYLFFFLGASFQIVKLNNPQNINNRAISDNR